MAKIIVAIDVPDMAYRQLAYELFGEKRNPMWFRGEDVTSGKVAIDLGMLERDTLDREFFCFELIGVKQ